MSRPVAVVILVGIGILFGLGGYFVAALFVVTAALIVDLLGPDTPSEAAYRRNHQARRK